jgi:hypothetical protein
MARVLNIYNHYLLEQSDLGQVFYRTVLVAPEYIWKKQRVKSDAQPINNQSTPEYI